MSVSSEYIKWEATHMTEEQERKEEGQASPHPGLETLWTPGEERRESLRWDRLHHHYHCCLDCTHRLWGPCYVFLPALWVCTNSHSGSSTGETGQSLLCKQSENTQKEVVGQICCVICLRETDSIHVEEQFTLKLCPHLILHIKL